MKGFSIEHHFLAAKLASFLLVTGLLASVALFVPGSLGLAAAIALVIFVSLHQLSRLRTDPLDAPALYVASSVVVFGVMSLAWLGSPQAPPPGVDQANITDALILVSAGLMCFTAGALVAGPPRIRRAPAPTESVRSSPVLIGIFVVGLAATAVGVVTGTIGYAADLTREQGVAATGEPIILLSGLAPFVVLCAAVIHVHRPHHVSRRTVVVLATLQGIAGVAAGFKGYAVLPVEYVVLAYLGAARRIPWRAVAAASVAVVFLVFPLVNGFRTQLQQGFSISEAGVRAVTDGEALRPDRALQNSQQYLLSRMRHADQVALIMRTTPEAYPFADGGTYTPSVLFQALPRAIWKDKPVLDQATQYAHTYWQIPENQHTATPMTQLGDLYRNFGWAGTLTGAFLLGLLLGTYQRVASRRATLRAEVLHVFVLVNFVAFAKVETQLPVLAGAVAKTLPLAIVVAFLAFPPHLQRTWNSISNHKVALASGTGLIVLFLALGAYTGPLTDRRSSFSLAGDAAAALEAQGAPRARRVGKPAESAALWNLSDTYDVRFGGGHVLILDFDTSTAAVQATGRVRPTRSGVLVHHNLVAFYDPARLNRQSVQRLHMALKSADR